MNQLIDTHNDSCALNSFVLNSEQLVYRFCVGMLLSSGKNNIFNVYTSIFSCFICIENTGSHFVMQLKMIIEIVGAYKIVKNIRVLYKTLVFRTDWSKIKKKTSYRFTVFCFEYLNTVIEMKHVYKVCQYLY